MIKTTTKNLSRKTKMINFNKNKMQYAWCQYNTETSRLQKHKPGNKKFAFSALCVKHNPTWIERYVESPCNNNTLIPEVFSTKLLHYSESHYKDAAGVAAHLHLNSLGRPHYRTCTAFKAASNHSRAANLIQGLAFISYRAESRKRCSTPA